MPRKKSDTTENMENTVDKKVKKVAKTQADKTTEKVESKNEASVETTKRRTKSNRPAVLTKTERKKLGIGKDEGRALLSNVRISPRKVAIVLNLIKNKNLSEALGILKFTPKAASPILYKLVKSAEANAVNNNNLNSENLYIAEAFANQATTLKRIMPRAQGRAFKIAKRASHITVVLKERN